MELFVISLILAEIIVAVGLALWGGRQQASEVKSQLEALHSVQSVLSNLQDSSKATADTLVQLKAVTDSMNVATHGQLAVSYDPSILVKYIATQKLEIRNNGHTNITLWGTRLGSEPPYFLRAPSVLPPNGGHEFDADTIFEQLQGRFQKEGSVSVPYEVYVKNELGRKFVIDCTLTFVSGNFGMSIVTQINGISRQEWRKN